MSLIFCDGFDHYGTDEGNMTDGAYAEVDTGVASLWNLSTANPRTGTHHLRKGTSTGAQVVRRVLGTTKTTVGQACVTYFNQLPTVNNAYVLYDFRDAGNNIQVSVVVQSTGIIDVKSGTMLGTSLGDSGTPAVVAEAYQHIETLVTIGGSGSVEVRVNGVTVVSLTGVNTNPQGTDECSQVALIAGNNTGATSHNVTTDIDDYFVYDDTGSFNNDFIGDRRVLTLFPNGDTAQADWSVTGAVNGFEAIDEADPDDDTTYISTGSGGSPGPVSEFDLDDLPTGVSAVSALVIVNRSKKTDAGDANTQLSIISGASEANGADRPITEAYTYYHDVIETDPATGAPFTPSAVDAAQLKIERTL